MSLNISRVSSNLPSPVTNVQKPGAEVSKAGMSGGDPTQQIGGHPYPYRLPPNIFPTGPDYSGLPPYDGDPGDNKIQPSPMEAGPSQPQTGTAGVGGTPTYYVGKTALPSATPAPAPKVGYKIDQSCINWKVVEPKFNTSTQEKYNLWKNAVASGTDPVQAARDLGTGSDVKQLAGTSNGVQQWQFRLSQDLRVSFDYDKATHDVRIIGIGHT